MRPHQRSGTCGRSLANGATAKGIRLLWTLDRRASFQASSYLHSFSCRLQLCSISSWASMSSRDGPLLRLTHYRSGSRSDLVNRADLRKLGGIASSSAYAAHFEVLPSPAAGSFGVAECISHADAWI